MNRYSGLIELDTLILDNTGEQEYKTYTSEFKTETLALISEQDYSTQEAASALDITTSLLYSWKNKEERHANSTVNTDERSELLALRKEVKQLRMEKKILKKARAFFTKEMKQSVGIFEKIAQTFHKSTL